MLEYPSLKINFKNVRNQLNKSLRNKERKKKVKII